MRAGTPRSHDGREHEEPTVGPSSPSGVSGVWAEIAALSHHMAFMPPRRMEPIKLTPGQWAILPHGDPRIPTYGRPLGDLMGIPVVMVATEEESTPVVEGWGKPKRRRRWQRVWPWGRS